MTKIMNTKNINYYKALIRVVKSLTEHSFGSETIVFEKLIPAENKEGVNKFLLKKYPQFFPNGKIHTRETKDQSQFFYVLIYELYQGEKNQLFGTEWKCEYCNQEHPDTYTSPPVVKKFGNIAYRFCGDVLKGSSDSECSNSYSNQYYAQNEIPDNSHYVSEKSPIYIYKITEKYSGKSYIGKTCNEPFFRWWNHIKHSSSPFGLYLKQTGIHNWTFEVLEMLPCETPQSEVFRKESEYIIHYDSIDNGFNVLISSKNVLKEKLLSEEINLFT